MKARPKYSTSIFDISKKYVHLAQKDEVYPTIISQKLDLSVWSVDVHNPIMDISVVIHLLKIQFFCIGKSPDTEVSCFQHYVQAIV